MTQTLVNYGLMSVEDAGLIARLLDQLSADFQHVNILEIGVRGGETSRSISSYMGTRPFSYWGIDNGRDMPVAAPFIGAHLIVGDSAEVSDSVPHGLHLVIIDGCHCKNHVILDWDNYSRKVVDGGVVVFHDTDPAVQGRDYQGHGPQTPDFHIAVLSALDQIGTRMGRWELIARTSADQWGGAMAFKKIA
jgi:hypothetical protein